jgi:hypothetical protein
MKRGNIEWIIRWTTYPADGPELQSFFSIFAIGNEVCHEPHCNSGLMTSGTIRILNRNLW